MSRHISLQHHPLLRGRASALATSLGALCATVGALTFSHDLSEARAEVRPKGIDLSVFGGFWSGGRHVENGSIFGLSGGYNFNRIFGVELKHTRVATRANDAPETINETVDSSYQDLSLQQGALNLMVHLSPHRFTPFFHAGLAWVQTDGEDGQEMGWHVGSNVGFGLRYFINDDLAIRAGLELWIADTNLHQEPYEHFAGTIGVTYQIGGVRDIDGDNIKNSIDRCPTQAEDMDGFEDSDGCPEPDNDKDGVKDEDDKCPNEAAEKDKDSDKDGCTDDTDAQGEAKKEAPKAEGAKKKGVDVSAKKRAQGDEKGAKDKSSTAKGALSALLGLQAQLTFVKSSAKLEDSAMLKARLTKLANALNKQKTKVRITVSSPSKATSKARAQAIRDALIERGVERSKLRISSLEGASAPESLERPDGHSDAAWVSITKLKPASPKSP